MHSTCHPIWDFLRVFVNMGLSDIVLVLCRLLHMGLSRMGFSHKGLSYISLFHMGLSYKGSSYMGLSYMGLSFMNLSYKFLSTSLSYTGLYYMGLSYVSFSYMGLSYKGLSYMSLSYTRMSYMGLSYMGLSYTDPCPLSQAPSSILQVGSQQTGTAPVTEQVTPPTCQALPRVPTVPPIHGAAHPPAELEVPQSPSPGCALLHGTSPAPHLHSWIRFASLIIGL